MTSDLPPLLARVSASSTATLHEAAGKIGALPSYLKGHDPGVRLCGRAFPVQSPPGDNLWLHHAIYQARPGDVLVVATGHALEFGYWGEVMAVAAQAREIAGLIIDGGVRDVDRMLDLGFPVFSAAPCIRGTAKDVQGAGSLGQPVTIGDVTIALDDIVLGDRDGVMILPAADAERIVDLGYGRDAEERDIFASLKNGATTLDIYGLAPPAALAGAVRSR